jgi:hypothetical protein
MDAGLRHLPGGVDQYLALREQESATSSRAQAVSVSSGRAAAASAGPSLTGAGRRNAEKEVVATERRIARLQADIVLAHDRLAAHDQSDYVGLGELTSALRELESTVADLETRWLELSESLEA